jgi:glycosyltransferase involved in cell wall biosynthesis
MIWADSTTGKNQIEMPDISIVIPTFNRAAQLARTLTSIAREVPASNAAVEVIVVDNGSTDATEAAYKTVTGDFPKRNWRYVYEPMPGLLSGRHRGANEAQGEILAYLDDDVVLRASWLDGLVDAFGNPEVALVGGPSLPEYEAQPPGWLESLWHYDGDGRRTLFELSLIDPAPRSEPGSARCLGAQFFRWEGCLAAVVAFIRVSSRPRFSVIRATARRD